MSDNEWQSKGIHAAYGSLDVHFQDDPNVYVVADILVYPTQGESRRIGPDILVAKGVPKLPKRSSYKGGWRASRRTSCWRSRRLRHGGTTAAGRRGSTPRWAWPSTGCSTPRANLFQPPLEGHRLESGVYRPLPARASSAGRVLKSEVLGLELRAEGELLRFHDPATGQDLRTHREAEARVAELEALVRELGPRRR